MTRSTFIAALRPFVAITAALVAIGCAYGPEDAMIDAEFGTTSADLTKEDRSLRSGSELLAAALFPELAAMAAEAAAAADVAHGETVPALATDLTAERAALDHSSAIGHAALPRNEQIRPADVSPSAPACAGERCNASDPVLPGRPDVDFDRLARPAAPRAVPAPRPLPQPVLDQCAQVQCGPGVAHACCDAR